MIETWDTGNGYGIRDTGEERVPMALTTVHAHHIHTVTYAYEDGGTLSVSVVCLCGLSLWSLSPPLSLLLSLYVHLT